MPIPGAPITSTARAAGPAAHSPKSASSIRSSTARPTQGVGRWRSVRAASAKSRSARSTSAASGAVSAGVGGGKATGVDTRPRAFERALDVRSASQRATEARDTLADRKRVPALGKRHAEKTLDARAWRGILRTGEAREP